VFSVTFAGASGGGGPDAFDNLTTTIDVATPLEVKVLVLRSYDDHSHNAYTPPMGLTNGKGRPGKR
jgi:hypothetical protein